ncbi:MAG: tripartite tricarboxylate transporter substrate binding protein [Burkholderiales bacterium]|nr:MAG: tripartite tricarboxylate transporter substrate binding protein [Burkholderiales bacterium]
MLHKRLHCLAAAWLAAFAVGPAAAADYAWKPSQPITVVVPWGAGGATDQVTRVTAGVLETALGQKVVVVNTPGASGSIGKKKVWESARDGYTWAAGAPKQLGTYKLLGMWDTWVDDWVLYTTVTNVPMVSVNPDTPYQTMADLLAAMKNEEISVATAGAGSSGHAAIEALKGATGIQYKHVTYDGGNPAVIATVGGEAKVTTQLASEQAQMVRAKRLRPLAVLADTPLEIEGYGTIPPITEFVKEKMPVLATSFGIFIPREGTPPEVLATFDQIWREVIPNSPELKSYALGRGALFTPSYGETARKRVWPEIQSDAWSFAAAGRAKVSPESLGIPKP